MDGSRFDQIARAFASERSRRGVIGGLAGLAAGLLGATRAAAVTCPPGQYVGSANRCLCLKTGRPPVGGNCPCSGGLVSCGGTCCLEGQLCEAGACCTQFQGSCETSAECCGDIVCIQGLCIGPPPTPRPTFV